MELVQKQADPPKRLKSDTRQWSSGRVMFAVIGWKDKPDKNYIVFEKNFFGRSTHPDQKFILRALDWQNLKKLVDGELNADTQWERQIKVVDQSSLSQLLTENPDIIEKVLSNPNILKLGDTSLEALDRLAIKLFEVKTNKIDLIINELSKASGKDLDTFSDLLEDLRLHQVSMMASLVYQKLKVIDLLERTCCDNTKSEKDVHRIFEKNIWLAGKNYEIVQSDRTLSQYLETNLSDDPETRKRPDLIIRTIPNSQDVILIEFKGPDIKLKAKHVGQVLEYKALIERNKPNVKNIYCYLFGYEKDHTFILSKDAEIKTFSELVSELRAEYQEYQRVIEQGKEVEETLDI